MVAPVPMEHIEHMAALCMKDLDEDGADDADLEDDAELLVIKKKKLGDQYNTVGDRLGLFNPESS